MATLYGKGISQLKGVGAKRAELFSKLGIQSVGALLRFYPRSYEIWSNITDIKSLQIGETAVFKGRVLEIKQVRARGGMMLFKVLVTDDENDITLTFFNNRFIGNILKTDETYLFRGKTGGTFLQKEMSSPEIMKVGAALPIKPIYPQTSGLASNTISGFVKEAISLLPEKTGDPIPLYIREALELCDLKYALQNIHFPENAAALESAERRLVFEELLVLQMGILMLGGKKKQKSGYIIKDYTPAFSKLLPFSETGAQKKATAQIISDMKSGAVMSRLLQGDVGSGKTVVAVGACFSTAKSGCQSAIMAPTEILAQQHFETFSRLLSGTGVKCALLTGSVRGKERKQILENLKSGKTDIIIGTHALLTDDVEFSNLALVITDEQHRFGVNQRVKLNEKGKNPHTLVMSATPIPRTLALMIYGDLDVSVLDELPPGRQYIETYAVSSDKRKRAYAFLRRHIDAGRQCYIICPLVEEGESDMASVQKYQELLQKEPVFSGCRINILHGKMKNKEKNEIMESFSAGKTDILISTTVVEVGVDVPNAVIMLIENAERYGLSQLHQLRGRVGRGKDKSYCILISDAQNDEAVKRLKTISSTNDGFKIAEEDLKLRGPGNFFGNQQHGLPKLSIADLNTDMDILLKAQEYSKKIISEDPELSDDENRALRAEIKLLFKNTDNSI